MVMHLDGMPFRPRKLPLNVVAIGLGQRGQVFGQLVFARNVSCGYPRLRIAQWPDGALGLKQADKNQGRLLRVEHAQVERDAVGKPFSRQFFRAVMPEHPAPITATREDLVILGYSYFSRIGLLFVQYHRHLNGPTVLARPKY